MNILMVTYLFPPAFGGAIVQAMHLGVQLQKLGHAVSFLTDAGGAASSNDRHESFAVFRRATTRGGQRSLWRQLVWGLRILAFAWRHPEFRIFHFHSVRGPELLCMPVLRLMGRRTIYKITLADSDDPLALASRRRMGPMYRWCLQQVDRIVAISPVLRELSLKAGIDARRIVLVANGVNLRKFHFPPSAQRQALREKLGFAPGRKVILSIGAVESRKGYAHLLRAFEAIRSADADAMLVIAGPGNTAANAYYAELQDFIAAQGLRDVVFLGERKDVPDLMMAADLFAFCSSREGLPNVMLEAMCCGLGIVSLHIEGITDWLLEGRELAVDCLSEDPEVFAAACLRLLSVYEPEAGLAQSHKAATRFGIEVIARRYQDLYGELRAAA